MSTRRLTISCCHPERRAARPVYVNHRPLEPMPFLRLRGRWLDQAGFAIGSQVRVAVSRGRLIVEVVEPEPHPKPSHREQR